MNPYQIGLEKKPANYQPLTPLGFLERSASVYPEQVAIIHGSRRYNWSQVYDRCRRLASALTTQGIGKGDTVAVIAANTPELYEAHFGIPMAGAILNAINTRLDARAIAFVLQHSEARVLMTDSAFHATVAAALSQVEHDILVIDIEDSEGPGGKRLGTFQYEDFIATGAPDFCWQGPEEEWDAISLNYTSGTTGDPKGVVYHHRGAYLNAMANIVAWEMAHHPVYLWTLPMFHCNGWCFPWTLAALAGTSICLRTVSAKTIYQAIDQYRVSHFCGAPIISSFLINATDQERKSFNHKIKVMTAAAPPPAAVLSAMKQQGFTMTHVYGLTETYGPAVICAWHRDWDTLDLQTQTRLKSRQGVRYHVLDGLTVMDPATMEQVPADGETIGEIMFRGNIVMKGYLKNPDTTEKALQGGWFHSGDLAVIEPDGYIKIKDRSKDVIISGGENISSIEVEDTLYRHPAVLEAAVVARPDAKWGETPCAFVTLREGHEKVSEQDLIDFCRANLAHFKAPKTVIFSDLPKTSTGKIQKFKLRTKVKALGCLR